MNMETQRPVPGANGDSLLENQFAFEDEILKELYEAKARLNREANYSVTRLLANARGARFPDREQPAQQQVREGF
jgi:hypothetical protein